MYIYFLLKKALKIDPQNPKALFRRGQAYFEMEDLYKAQEDFEKVLASSPNDPKVKQELQKIEQKLKKYEKKEKEVYGKMFQ